MGAALAATFCRVGCDLTRWSGRNPTRETSYFFFSFGSTIWAAGTWSNLAISLERVWAFLPSVVQPGRMRTTRPPLSMRMLVGIALASKVFHKSPLGSDSHMKLIFFLTV